MKGGMMDNRIIMIDIRKNGGEWLVTMRLADWAVREKCYIKEWEE